MRTKGSCRFEPYYKIQVRNETVGAWQDIQKSFPTPEKAWLNCPHDKVCRIMEVTEKGRQVILGK